MEGRIKMKIATLFLLLVTILVTILLLVPPSIKILSISEDFTLNSSNISYSTAQLTPHLPIVIDGNSEFTAQASTEGWSGNGTASSPYTIDRLNISDATSPLIEICKVDLHFRIVNCLLTGGNNGISFYSVKNVQVLNNTVANNSGNGIELWGSSNNNFIINNTVTNNNGTGILLRSYWLTPYNNTLTNNTVANNYYGIRLSSSFNNTLCTNNLTNNEFIISGDPEKIRQTEVVGNLVNRKPLIFWQDTVGGTVPANARQIILINTTGVEVTGQNISNTFNGLRVIFSQELNIHDNTFVNCGNGIKLDYSFNNTLTNNTVVNNSRDGIKLDYSFNNTLANNTVANNSNSGITLAGYNNTLRTNNLINNGFIIHFGDTVGESRQTEVIDNFINGKPLIFWQDTVGGTVPANAGQIILINTTGVEVKGQNISNTFNGLLVGFSQELNIHDNTFVNNSGNGIKLDYSFNNALTNNTVANNSGNGIGLFRSSNNNVISNNMVTNNRDYGIDLSFWIKNNTVSWNSFLGNHLGGIYQAHDSGFNNTFSYNYWDNWLHPDANGDGIVDVPYPIDGGNQDAFPLVFSFYAQHQHHFLLPPRIIFPNGREILDGSITISWFSAYDSRFHTIKYSVYFSSDAGNTWTLLVGNILNTYTHTNIEISQLTWNAGILPSGSNYMVKVIATCSEGLTCTDISDEPFNIINSSGTSSTTLPTSNPSTGTAFFLVVITLLIIIKFRKKN